ncbi:MAG TPA: rhomboid family intramembrane serine protease [Chthoniobacterales bacterium]|nr:rhomboid family intramembrane serine protease [Chthoniobacterales bacterium]
MTTSDDYKPVTYVGRFPVDITTLLVAVHALTMIVGTLLIAARQTWLLQLMIFDSDMVLRAGHVWQVVTYAFVHQPSIWFVIHLFMLFFFGREVERFIGQRAFIVLYLGLLLLPAFLLTIWGLAGRISYADSDALHFGVFVAFAAIYPGVELIFRIQAKWMALVFGVISALQYLAQNAWPQLGAFLISVGFAVYFIRMRGAGPELGWWRGLREKLQPKPKFHVVPKAAPRRKPEPEDIHQSIDPLLEKISKHGINSLTPSERKALDRARNQLLKKSP